MTQEKLLRGILEGDKRLLSKGLTLTESKKSSDIKQARELLNDALPHTGKSIRVGITGAPGVGKSTFLEQLGNEILKSHRNLAILSIDPTSPASGGSILGDKTRMESLVQDERVFIRPSPSGTQGGGIGSNTRDQILLCEAAGYEVILVETVGVGQGETAVSLMVDYLLLLIMPGGGDDLQGIKRGIMEVAHAFAITKKDIIDQNIVNKSLGDLKMALHMLNAEIPPIFTCSGLTGEGIPAIWDNITEFRDDKMSSGDWAQNRAGQDLKYFESLSQKFLLNEIMNNQKVKTWIEELKGKINNKSLTPVSAAEILIERYFQSI